jgi:hypothetical protein
MQKQSFPMGSITMVVVVIVTHKLVLTDRPFLIFMRAKDWLMTNVALNLDDSYHFIKP